MNRKIPKLNISIRNQSDGVSEIDIDGEIGWINENGEWNTAPKIKEKLKEIDELEASKIIVNINSFGGFVADGLAIHDVLAQHQAKVETHVFGMTASAATIIAQAGDKRFMSANSLYLIHRAWGLGLGNVNDMIAVASDLEAIDKRILNIYTKRSGKSEAEIEELMNENDGGGKWIDADEALEFGLIDEAFEPMKAAASMSAKDFKAAGLPVPDDAKDKGITIPVNFDLESNGLDLTKIVEDVLKNRKENGSNEPDEEIPEGISLEEARNREVEILTNKERL